MSGGYISREAALTVLDWDCASQDALDAIKAIPAADVVEVVRCQDCYFRALDGANVPVCTGAMAYSYTLDDWFCAGGKPKDGGGE